MNRRLWAYSALLMVACGGADESVQPGTGDFSDVFHEVRRITLEDTPEALIGFLEDVMPVEDGVLVVDRMTNRVLAFSHEGRFIGAIGRDGDGPGEFRHPHQLIEDVDGTVLVVDYSQRVTRLSPDLTVLDVFRLDVPNVIGGLSKIGDRLVVRLVAPRLEGDNFVFWDPHVGLGTSFDPRNPLLRQVPYWNAAFTVLIAANSKQVFVSDNMIYPFRIYSAAIERIDTAGFAPPSWKQASRPERGQFATPGQLGAEEWLRSFTVVDRLATIGDQFLLVSHRERVNAYPSDDVFRLDVYDVEGSATKLWQDLRLPGPLLASGTCAWIVVTQPPDPWTLGCYELTEP